MGAKMGFEGKIFYGVAGGTGGTEITNSRDINYDLSPDKGDTTVRGAGTSPPIKTSRVTAIGVSIEWTMIQKDNDAVLEALKTAAAAGVPVAIRTKDYAAGKGFDGDCTLAARRGAPIAGEQTVQFTAEPTDEGGRAPQLYV
jgi:hypothetical protein